MAKNKKPAKGTDKKKYAPFTEEVFNEMLTHVVRVESKNCWLKTSLLNDSASDTWREYTWKMLEDGLVSRGYSKADASLAIARLHADPRTMSVACRNVLDEYPLRDTGYQYIKDKAYFVRGNWPEVSSKKGDPTPVVRVVMRMFGTEADIFLGWLQGAVCRQMNYRAKARGAKPPFQPLASQTICICGPQGTGKSNVLRKFIIEGTLGTVSVVPASWYLGKSNFGDWMLHSTVYLFDDFKGLSTVRARKDAAELVKGLGYPEKLSCECKCKGSVTVDFPNERIFFSNLETKALTSLPEFMNDPDKALILYNCAPCGVEDEYHGDCYKMDEDLMAALPAFVHWLVNDYKIPDWAVGGDKKHRHAVMNLGEGRGYASPHVTRRMAEIDQAGLLMRKLMQAAHSPATHREFLGRALSLTDIGDLLSGFGSRIADNCTCDDTGSLLSVCSRRWPKLLQKSHTREGNRYMCLPVDDWQSVMSAASVTGCVEAIWNEELLKMVGLTKDDIERSAI